MGAERARRHGMPVRPVDLHQPIRRDPVRGLDCQGVLVYPDFDRFRGRLHRMATKSSTRRRSGLVVQVHIVHVRKAANSTGGAQRFHVLELGAVVFGNVLLAAGVTVG